MEAKQQREIFGKMIRDMGVFDDRAQQKEEQRQKKLKEMKAQSRIQEENFHENMTKMILRVIERPLLVQQVSSKSYGTDKVKSYGWMKHEDSQQQEQQISSQPNQ